MRITISGESQRFHYQENIRQATKFFLKELIRDPVILKELKVKIKFIKSTTHLGYCEWLDSPYKASEFVIELNDAFTERPILKSLAHECVHLKQFALGEVHQNLNKVNVMRWHNRNYKIVDANTKSYYYQPWEIEANGLMEFLYNEYMLSKYFARKGKRYEDEVKC